MKLSNKVTLHLDFFSELKSNKICDFFKIMRQRTSDHRNVKSDLRDHYLALVSPWNLEHITWTLWALAFPSVKICFVRERSLLFWNYTPSLKSQFNTSLVFTLHNSCFAGRKIYLLCQRGGVPFFICTQCIII